jgi:hypothetical protein
VEIGAADAAPGYLNLKLLRRRFGWLVYMLNPNVLPAIPDCTLHK